MILYTRLSGYILSCLNALSQIDDNQLLVIHWETSEEAPFSLELNKNENIRFLSKETTRQQWINTCLDFSPQIVFISGWMDNDYCHLGRLFRQKQLPVIMSLDNPWRNTIRQRIGTLVFPWKFAKSFSHIWAAGKEQYEFARRLSYPPNKIMTGLYSADTSLFCIKKITYPKILLFVGRLLEWKGILDLYAAFNQVEHKNGWKLWIVGSGGLKNQLIETENIRLKGFVQPHEMPALIEQAGCFILPSHDEHWGVVVHEFAAAGLPLILSDKVRAGETFLIPKYNGFRFPAKNIQALKNALEKIFSLDETALKEMGNRSQQLASYYSPEFWARKLMSIQND